MSRRFPDFLKAFEAFSDDGFVPPQFNTWVGLSIIAAALERKVWLPMRDVFTFPNIFTVLISAPGDGKSTAVNRGVDLLRDMDMIEKNLNILPNNLNTPTLFARMKDKKTSFTVQRGKEEIAHHQHAGYFYLSEGSNGFDDEKSFGSFFSAVTNLYDCDSNYSTSRKVDGTTKLTNICFNLLVAVTFEHLNKIINDKNMLGGFASRLIYVVSKNKEVIDQDFDDLDDASKKERKEYRNALIEDLFSIHKMSGAITMDHECAKAWKEFRGAFERQRRTLSSEKLQSIMARTVTNLQKVSMLLSISESDEKVITLKHWNKALELVMPLYDEIPSLFIQAKANSSDRSAANIGSIILHMASRENLNLEKAKGYLTLKGYNQYNIDQNITALIATGAIRIDNGVIKVIGNPDYNF